MGCTSPQSAFSKSRNQCQPAYTNYYTNGSAVPTTKGRSAEGNVSTKGKQGQLPEGTEATNEKSWRNGLSEETTYVLISYFKCIGLTFFKRKRITKINISVS